MRMFRASRLLRGKKPEPFRKWMSETYTSPYALRKCPLDAVVLYNPSMHANNVAIEDLLTIWPDLPIIQTMQEGRRTAVGATDRVEIPKGAWGNMELFQRCWTDYVARNRWLQGKKVGLYPMWSPMSEDPKVARAVIKIGLHWVGAEPDAMDGLGKIEYKRFCRTHNMSTSPFIELSDINEPDHDAAARRIMETYFKNVKGTPMEGQPFFVKSDYGGGGRGTKKAEPTKDSVLNAARKVIAETNRTDAIYGELALDFTGARLFQIELEADAGNVVDGGRMVYFNARNQKMIELGYSSSEIIKYLPEAVYKECMRCADIVARLSKYDGRGTNEILIVKQANGEWKIYNSEFNKRIQVEHKALSYLFRYKEGQLFNTCGDQLMRSCGYPPPDYTSDLIPSGASAVGHVRLIAPTIANNDVSFPSGVTVDALVMPKGFTATCDFGQLYTDTDAQFGCVLVLGQDWQHCIKQLQYFSANSFIFGTNVTRDYFTFLQKFFMDAEVADLTLPCNKTFDVLDRNRIPADTPTISTAKYLQGSIAKTLVNSWRPEAGVPNRPWPSKDHIETFDKLKTRLTTMPVLHDTPFYRYIEHGDEDRYFDDLRQAMAKQGGGMISVFPRDVQQEMGCSESHLLTATTARLMEVMGADVGYFGLESGGAQYQTAEMININSNTVIEKSLMTNMGVFSLTRSQWMNALEVLSEAEIRYILTATANLVRRRYNLPAGSKVPYFPYNFHAGNIADQDIVTGLMLEVGITPLPNFCWDPRFTAENFKGWMERQLALWAKHGRKLHHIRIKNAGQMKEWTCDNIMGYIKMIRTAYKKAYGDKADPIVHIHNHNFNGNSSHALLAALQECQKIGFNYLMVDTAPPYMTHNSNLVVSKGLHLTKDQRDKLDDYNESCHAIWQTTCRFHDFPLVNTDPYSIWAGGTGTSDQIAARKVGIARTDVEDAKVLGAQVTGLGAIVTPFSQWSMVTGFTCYQQGFKEFDQVLAHIKKGGTLNLPINILQGLDKWPSLLNKPEHVKLLINNHKAADPETFQAKPVAKTPLNLEAIKAQISEVAPHRTITEFDIARVISYRDFALKTIKAEENGQDYTWAMHLPHIAFAQKTPIDTKFDVNNIQVTFSGREEIANSADVRLTFAFKGATIRVTVQDSAKAAAMKGAGGPQIAMADPSNPNHCGAFMPGMVEAVYVKVGQSINAGDQLYAVNSMKMVTAFKASPAHQGKKVARICVQKGDELNFLPGQSVPLVIELA